MEEMQEELIILEGDFNVRIGTEGEMYIGEEEENTSSRKSKDKREKKNVD